MTSSGPLLASSYYRRVRPRRRPSIAVSSTSTEAVVEVGEELGEARRRRRRSIAPYEHATERFSRARSTADGDIAPHLTPELVRLLDDFAHENDDADVQSHSRLDRVYLAAASKLLGGYPNGHGPMYEMYMADAPQLYVHMTSAEGKRWLDEVSRQLVAVDRAHQTPLAPEIIINAFRRVHDEVHVKLERLATRGIVTHESLAFAYHHLMMHVQACAARYFLHAA